MACEREIMDLSVQCSSIGCLWVDELRELENHESTCPLKLVQCTIESCQEKMKRKELSQHVDKDCLWRETHCIYCLETYIWKFVKDHYDVCKKYPMQCVNGCGRHGIPREQMNRHTQNVCERAVLSCKYQHIGCNVKGQRNAIQTHINENMEAHLDMACSKIKDLHSFTFIWRITNFSKHLQDAKNGSKMKLESAPFHTSPYGYKMRVMICPRGTKSAKDINLSPYIIIMKGDYDSILTWPYLPRVTFTLIDQQDTNEKLNIVKSLKAESTWAPFARPVHYENTGMGFPTFVSLEDLQTRRYIVNDTLFLKVKVESPF